MPLPRNATPPPVISSPIPPASGFENEEEVLAVASEVVQRPPPPVRRSSSSGGGRHFAAGSSTTSIASTVATKRRLSKTDGLTSSVTSSSTASKRGYNCCSKREKSSALAALIGCISLASLMTGLVTDLWVNTDEWIPSAAGNSGSEKLDASQAELPNLQPRSQQEASDRIDHRYNQQEIKRVHFAVGLWTVCPSHPDNHLLKGKHQTKMFLLKRNPFACNMDAHFILLTSQRIIWIPLAEAINAQHSLKKKGKVASSFSLSTDAVA